MGWVLIVTTLFSSGYRSYEHLGWYSTKTECESRAEMVRSSLAGSEKKLVVCEVRATR